MSSYVFQKVAEKTNLLQKLERQLSELPRQIELLQAELSTLQDVLTHEAKAVTPRMPARKAKPKRPKSRIKAKQSTPIPSKSTGSSDGHWGELIRIYERAAKPFTIDDVENYLNSIGRPNMRKSIRAKLVVLVNKGILRRESDGIFTVSSALRGVSGDELRAHGIIPRQARLVGEAA